MGDPKKSKKMYSRPKARWSLERIQSEKEIVKTYGLVKKKELWRMESIVRDLKRRARALLGEKNEVDEKVLINKVIIMGISEQKGKVTVDDLLDLKVESVLDRRLQTIVYKSGLANTMKQARQFIVHGHILVDGIKSSSPGRLIKVEDEGKVSFAESSSLNASFVKAEKSDSLKKPLKEEVEAALVKKLMLKLLLRKQKIMLIKHLLRKQRQLKLRLKR